jgi:hypothetical protein
MANQTAWTLATHPEPKFRNGTEALWLARQVCEATGHQRAEFLDTLAAANAEAGRFDEAVATGRKALARAQEGCPNLVPGIQGRFRLYESRRPYREEGGARRPE